MALLYITEYEYLCHDADGHVVMAGREPAHARQKVDFTSGETQSAAFTLGTRIIRVWSDTEGFTVVNANPTATTASDTPLAAKSAEYFGVQPGDKISIVQ